MTDLDRNARRLCEILGLATEPVAVFLLDGKGEPSCFPGAERLADHRYCQALMRARHGEIVTLDAEGLSCPAAAAAFGFRALPEGLGSGKGLVAYGIVHEAETGRVMFEQMPRLAPGEAACIALMPLGRADRVPDVVVVEGLPEPLMWLVLADLNRAGGVRRVADTAVLQATCVDSTVIPYKDGRLNFSIGCYGCREATDLEPQEAMLGFPGSFLEALVAELERLAEKALPRSRGKQVYRNLAERSAATAEGTPRPAAGGAARGLVPPVDREVIVRLSREDVVRVLRAALDRDRDAALELVTGTLEPEVRRTLQAPHCVPAFEMPAKLGDKG